MRWWVACNDLWSWPIFSRSLSYNFAIQLLEYGTSCHFRSTSCTVLEGFFPNLAQIITSMRGCVTWNDLWSCLISSGSLSHDLAIKLLKYGIPCYVRSTARTIMNEFFPYLAQMVTSIGGCVSSNDLWPWPILSMLFSWDIANFMDYIHMWHKYHPWGDDVSRIISWSIGQGQDHIRHSNFAVGWGYSMRSLIYSF